MPITKNLPTSKYWETFAILHVNLEFKYPLDRADISVVERLISSLGITTRLIEPTYRLLPSAPHPTPAVPEGS